MSGANTRLKRRLLWLAVALSAALAASATLASTAQPGAANPPGHTMYMPLVARPALTPTPTPTVTPTATATPLPPILDVRVEGSCSNFRGGSAQDPNGEYVCFKNYDSLPADMAAWRVQDASGHTYTFPPFTLPVGATVRLHSGPGADVRTDLYWACGLVWNNSHDTVYLLDSFGRLVSRYVY